MAAACDSREASSPTSIIFFIRAAPAQATLLEQRFPKYSNRPVESRLVFPEAGHDCVWRARGSRRHDGGRAGPAAGLGDAREVSGSARSEQPDPWAKLKRTGDSYRVSAVRLA